MSQVTDLTIANGTGAAVRTALNALTLAQETKHSGTSEPGSSSRQPYMFWLDTTTNALKMRNAANTGWIVVADILTSPSDQLKFYSQGAAVLTQGANTFTATQKIDKPSVLGDLQIGSDLNLGVTARLTMFGENASDADVTGFEIDADETTNTAGAESFNAIFKVRQAGTLTTRMTLGSTVAVTGTLNATTLQQGGTALNTIIGGFIDTLDPAASGETFSGAYTLVQADSGFFKRFTGSSPANITMGRMTVGSTFVIHNDGTATLTVVSAAASNDVTIQTAAVTIPAGKTATIMMVQAGGTLGTSKVRIFGENA